ncbi:MAG: DUF3473 domain-containing protein, partial [Gammaproteobacteria bacterium]
MINYMTIDLEEWFHGLTSTAYRPGLWPELERRIEIGSHRLLDIFDEHSIQATFFVVGDLAAHRPGIVREIAERGHEIALHSNMHQKVREMTPEEFGRDLDANIESVTDAAGCAVSGYRAPAFSVDPAKDWIWETLADKGLSYSSSIFPFRTPLYGSNDAQATPHRRAGVVEIPMTTARTLGQKHPFSGGFYFRALPYWFVRQTTRRENGADRPVIFYFHPWEFDPQHPRPDFITRRERVSHYLG